MTCTYGAAQRREALSPDETAERRCDGLSLEAAALRGQLKKKGVTLCVL